MSSLWMGTKKGMEKLASGPFNAMVKMINEEIRQRQRDGWMIRTTPTATLGLVMSKHGEPDRMLFIETNSPPTHDLEIGQPKRVDGKFKLLLTGGAVVSGASDA